MEERFIRLERRVGRVENKVDTLTGVVADLDKRMQLGFAAVDKRFVEMDAKIEKVLHVVGMGRLVERFWWIGIAIVVVGVLARAMKWI